MLRKSMSKWLEFLLKAMAMLIIVEISANDWRSSAKVVSIGSGCVMVIKSLYWRAAHLCCRRGGLEELSTFMSAKAGVLGSGLLRLCLTC
jgi:hypothetical protein